MKKQHFIIFCLILFVKTIGLNAQDICINEFLASNVSVDADIIDFDDYSDWIELYNDENVEVDISGYSLTDNPDQPGKWIIPIGTTIQPKRFLRFWADGYDAGPEETFVRPWLYYPDMNQKWIYFTTDYYHLSFSLSRAGEYIGLYDPVGNVVDSVTFGLQFRDVSMGRKPDGASAWFYFGEPTPESSNVTEGILDPVATDPPQITPESGFYASSQTVTLSSVHPGESIKYTLDGSKPMSNSASYDVPLDLTETTVLRSRLFEPGKLPGPMTDRTYFIDEDFSLPVISIITPPEALWDPEKGIYETRMKSREIPVRFQYFPEGSEPLIDMNAGLRLSGQLSLYCPQISFTIDARDRYGADEISGRIFAQRELNSFKSLYLRNSGVPDNWITHFRDAISHSLVVNKMDLDCQAFQPSVLYLNGKYWGLYNIREKINSDYLASLHHLNPDDIDLLEYESGESTPEVLEGSGEDYARFYEFIESHDLSSMENYDIIDSWLEVDEFINYQICEIYFDNIIWPYINVRMWRERKEGAKWRWILFDTDFGFGMPNPGSTGYTNNTLAFATSSPTVPDPPPDWSTLIFRKMLDNPEFRTRFIQRFSGYLNSVFHPDTVVGVISDLQSTLGPEMVRHIERWRYETFEFGSPIPSYGTWTSSVNVMKDFARNRPRFQRQHIVNYFGLEGTSVVNVHIDQPGAGRVWVNEIVSVDSSASGIYFKGIPINLRAVPEVGFKFAGWEGISEDSVNIVDFLPGSDTITVTALFDTIVVSKVPAEIAQDTVLLKVNSPYYATGDIIVPPGKTLTVEGGVDLFMPEKANIIVYGKLIIGGTGDEPVKILPNEHSSQWGGLCFVEATDSSVISDLYISGATKGVDFARDRAAISGYRSSFSLNNVTIENSVLPVFVQFGKVSISGCRLRSGTTGDLINIKKAEYAIVEGCDL
ncbi:MAG: CotH kinase family protein, partial [Bacteroidales bacterium]